jgi:hypothetical protein
MKAQDKPIKLPTQNDAVMAQTLGKIYKLLLKPPKSRARRILNDAKLQQLIMHLLVAPEEYLPSC